MKGIETCTSIGQAAFIIEIAEIDSGQGQTVQIVCERENSLFLKLPIYHLIFKFVSVFFFSDSRIK